MKTVKQEKTNVMRVLEQNKIAYESFCYVETGAVSGMEVAEILKEDPSVVFKTLVTIGATRQHYVFMVPVCMELNLKLAAKAVGEKSIEMIKARELLPLTGYIHGGCSPIGMKKAFPTVIDISAGNYDEIYYSGGKIGYQVRTRVDELVKLVNAKLEAVAE